MNESVAEQSQSVDDLVGRVADEFIEALDRGARPDVEEIAQRHPKYAVVLRDVLTALLAMRSSPDFITPADLPLPVDSSGCLGDFRIVREIGRGGMGVVYEAEQISLGRRVALKVLPFAAAMNARQLVRFRTEAQAAAHLHHTNIVPVYAVGSDRGVHYYAMQFIDGQTLAAVIHGLRTTTRQAPADATSTTVPAAGLMTFRSTADSAFFSTVARLGIQAAEALEHAHQMGVIHRDVKPANFLLETGSHLWVTDFGLARLQDDVGVTMTGDLLGTLAYMSPEQARGKPALLDHRTDVYSLGASLYELLAFVPPFRAAGRAELQRSIAEDEPAPLRKLNRAVPTELETIVLKALARSPADRYMTAQELADDLRRFLEDKPILARRPSIGQRARRWARRHRSAVRAGAAAGVVAVLTVLIGLTISNVAIKDERDRARKAEADRSRQLYDALVARAEATRLAGRMGARAEALAALEEAAGLAPGLEPGSDRVLRLRNELIAATTMPDIRVEREWEGRPAGTRAVAFDAELRRYARCEPDGTVTVRRVADDTEEVRLERAVSRPVNTSLSFSPHGGYLAVWAPGSNGGPAAVWNLASGRVALPFDRALHLEFSPADRRVAVRTAAGPLQVLELDTGREVARFTPDLPAGPFNKFRFDPRGQMLAVHDFYRAGVEVWHLSSPHRPRKLGTPDRQVETVEWHPGGKQLAATSGREIYVWDLGGATDEPRLTLGGHLAQVVGLAFSPPDRGLLASTSYDETLRLWDARSGRLVLTAPGSRGPWFGRDGRLAYGNGTRLVVARADPPEGVRTVHLSGGSLGGVVDVSPDGRLLTAQGWDGVYFWDVATGTDAGILPIGRTAGVAFEPDGGGLVTGGRTPLARWPIAPGPAGAIRVGPPTPVRVADGRPARVALSGNGRALVANVGDEVHVLDWPDGAVRRRLRAQQGFEQTAVSPDGRWVAAGCLHGLEARVWDSASGDEVHRLTFPWSTGCLFEFSPDGRWLVAATPTEYVAFEPGTWRRAWAVRRAAASSLVAAPAISPDGQLLAVAHSPTLVKLYRTGSGEEVAALPSPDPHLLSGFRFSPDGSRLVATTFGKRLFVWDFRVLRARLARLGLDWDLPPYPPADGYPSPAPVNVDLGDLHPARVRAADLRRAIRDKPDDPRAANDLAWVLVTGPADVRDPEAALPLAELAVRLEPRQLHLNTLGVVYYRLGRWHDAVGLLDRSIAASKDPTAFDTFFLAMCHQRLGKPKEAHAEYARAVAWMELFHPDDEELIRFRGEADALLGR